jgi:hypothetical protein
MELSFDKDFPGSALIRENGGAKSLSIITFKYFTFKK